MDGYATKTYVDAADKKHTLDITNLTYHVQNIIEPTIVQKSDKGHKHTLSEITDYSAPDLSKYAKKTDIPDVSNFLTEVPNEYVTDTELNAKGYLTEHQDLSAYATKQFVNNAVAGVEPDLSNYATKTYVTNTVNAAIDDIPAPDLSNYYNKAQTDAAIEAAAESVEVYAASIANNLSSNTYGYAYNTDLTTLSNRVDVVETIRTNVYIDITGSDNTIPEDIQPILWSYYNGECRDYQFYLKVNSLYYMIPVLVDLGSNIIRFKFCNQEQSFDTYCKFSFRELSIHLNTMKWTHSYRTEDFYTKEYIDTLEARIAALEGTN